MLPTIRKVTIFQKVFYNGAGNEIQKINFEDNEDLRNVRIWGISTYYRAKENSNMRKDPNYNLSIFTLFQLQKSFLNLLDINGNNFVKNIPLINFSTLQTEDSNSGANAFDTAVIERDNKFFTGQKLDLQNSFVSVFKPLRGTFVLPLEIYYTRIDLDENNLDKLIK